MPRALLAGLAAAVIALHAWAQPTAEPSVSLLPAAHAASVPFAGVGLSLPAADRGLRVTNTLATDVDRDGDLDAVAMTRRGRVLVWINGGDGRLVRLVPEQRRPKRSRLSGPVSALVATRAVSTSDRLDGLTGARSVGRPAPAVRSRHSQSAVPAIQRHLETAATRGPPAFPTTTVP